MYPGIFDRFHSIGYVTGVLPNTLKSYARCVYFQMYSASTTKYFPNACCSPAWNSFLQPGLSGVVMHGYPWIAACSAFTTTSLQPVLDSTRFSLNGVSSVRA